MRGRGVPGREHEDVEPGHADIIAGIAPPPLPADAHTDALRDYWEERLRGDYSLGGVGYQGLGETFNRWGYRARRRVFLRLMRPLIAPGARVLDIGSGTGFYLGLWRELGAGSVTGSDLTAVAVERLAARQPGVEAVRLDTMMLPISRASGVASSTCRLCLTRAARWPDVSLAHPPTWRPP